MHLKRTHSAINKIIPLSDGITSDTGEAVNALTPEICNVSTNTSKSKIRINNEEIFENDQIMNFEEAAASDNDNQTAKSILTRDLALIVSSLLSELIVPRKTAQFLIKSLSVFMTTSLTLALQKWHDNNA